MTLRRERKDAAEHRELILQTAKQLFSEHGVHPVSMHQIAKTAGIGQATLYRRYSHKGDLCSAILKDYSHQLMHEITVFLQENQDLPPEDRLIGIVDRWIDAIEDKSELIMAMEQESKAVSLEKCQVGSEDRSNFFTSGMYRFFRDQLAKQIVEIAGSNCPEPFDPDLVAHAIICSMSPVGYFYMKQEKGYSKEQMKMSFHLACRCAPF